MTTLPDLKTLRAAIKLSKDATEFELGPIVSVNKEKAVVINNLPCTTFIEVLRGIMNSLPRSFTHKEEGGKDFLTGG